MDKDGDVCRKQPNVIVKLGFAVSVCVQWRRSLWEEQVMHENLVVISTKYLSDSEAANPDCDPLWFLARTEQ